MTPEDVVERAYELISFAAGGEPAWPEFRTLFTTPCVLALRVFPGDDAVTVMDLDAYMVHQMCDGLSEEGYSEEPGERTTTVVGDVAVVHQAFTMHFAGRPPVGALDVFSLVVVDGRWRIASIVSDITG